MRGFLRPLLISTAGLLMVPADTTTACLARTMANLPSLVLTKAPTQTFLDEVGEKLSRVSAVGAGDLLDFANRRRSTLVSTRNLAPALAASRSQSTGPLCFSL